MISKTANKLTRWEGFEARLQERQVELFKQLPPHIRKDRFISSTLSAVKQNVDLLKCTPRSLFAAITASASDGLLPDGKEGVITSYKNEAKWNPMTWGLRKRARELDDIIINAQVVHKNDLFEEVQGDDARVIHKPAPLGEDRGKMVGAYAIFRTADHILHREVMTAKEIEDTHKQSTAKKSLMWDTFTGEAWRKTVVRRGIKSVPCSEALEAVVRREDDFFDFDSLQDVTPPPAPQVDGGDIPPAARGKGREASGKDADQPSDEGEYIPSESSPPHAPTNTPTEFDPEDPEEEGLKTKNPDDYLFELSAKLKAMANGDEHGFAELREIFDSLSGDMFPPDVDKAEALFSKHEDRLSP